MNGTPHLVRCPASASSLSVFRPSLRRDRGFVASCPADQRDFILQATGFLRAVQCGAPEKLHWIGLPASECKAKAGGPGDTRRPKGTPNPCSKREGQVAPHGPGPS